MLKDRVLVVVVTHNNPVLLQHAFQSFGRHDPGYDCDFLVVDNSSDDPVQLKLLEKLAKKHIVLKAPNDRVEASFDFAWEKYPDYEYYFFMHDDSAANKDDWLKVFVDRMEGGYCEDIIKNTALPEFPIGRVGATTQFWRNYDSVLSYPVQCAFVPPALQAMGIGVPKIFKYSDNDRVLVRNQCLLETDGVWNLSRFKAMEQHDKPKFDKICGALNSVLPYRDEGIAPKELYPADQTWNKLCMLSEFLVSIITFSSGYRVVGLEGDGYLEQIHGYDVPWGNEYVHHFGQPSVKEFLAKQLNTDPIEIYKRFDDKIMLMKFDMLIKKYFKEQ